MSSLFAWPLVLGMALLLIAYMLCLIVYACFVRLFQVNGVNLLQLPVSAALDSLQAHADLLNSSSLFIDILRPADVSVSLDRPPAQSEGTLAEPGPPPNSEWSLVTEADALSRLQTMLDATLTAPTSLPPSPSRSQLSEFAESLLLDHTVILPLDPALRHDLPAAENQPQQLSAISTPALTCGTGTLQETTRLCGCGSNAPDGNIGRRPLQPCNRLSQPNSSRLPPCQSAELAVPLKMLVSAPHLAGSSGSSQHATFNAPPFASPSAPLPSLPTTGNDRERQGHQQRLLIELVRAFDAVAQRLVDNQKSATGNLIHSLDTHPKSATSNPVYSLDTHSKSATSNPAYSLDPHLRSATSNPAYSFDAHTSTLRKAKGPPPRVRRLAPSWTCAL